MSNNDDLREFNERVSDAGSPQAACGSKVKRLPKLPTSWGAEDVVEETKTTVAKLNGQMWAVYGDRNFMVCEKAVGILPAGQYTIGATEQGIYFTKVTTNIDDLIELPDSITDEIITEIETFWAKEDHFRKFGFLWKRGVLVWGAPGGGKTSCVQLVSKRIVERGGLAIFVTHPHLAAKGLEQLRHVEPHRPIVIILEDVDAIINEHGESDLLALMDGELQIDNVVFIATTNYPEMLDKRFVNRPSRFDSIKKIGMPGPEAREIYIKSKNTRLQAPESKEELDLWVDLTKDFSVAHIKELIVSAEVFQVPVADAAERLRTMITTNLSSADSTDRKFGFNA